MLSEDCHLNMQVTSHLSHKMFCCRLLSVVLFYKLIVISDCDCDCCGGDDSGVHGHE